MIALAYYAGGGSTASGACILGIPSLGKAREGVARRSWRRAHLALGVDGPSEGAIPR